MDPESVNMVSYEFKITCPPQPSVDFIGSGVPFVDTDNIIYDSPKKQPRMHVRTTGIPGTTCETIEVVDDKPFFRRGPSIIPIDIGRAIQRDSDVESLQIIMLRLHRRPGLSKKRALRHFLRILSSQRPQA